VNAEPAGAGGPARLAAACLVATVAFWAYTSTLLPGVDLGDTGGFQAAVLWPETSARRGYPLYYALATPFVGAVSASNPARGLNLFSAVWGALAVGLLTYAAALIARSPLAGAAAGLLLAFSYTFWTQAVIAEVYSLHLAFVAACLIALHHFDRTPTTGRLAIVMGLYALSFGNHLSMILLCAPFAVFILQVHPRPRDLFRPRVIALAVGLAAAGALLYAGNFLASWSSVDAPVGWMDRVAGFWFDTTKADWRESMVLGVGAQEARGRLSMWAWDARQQFGFAGLVLAAVGIVRLWMRSRPWAWLLTLAYGVSTLFALTYNVGDPHVFFLPGHLLTALAAAMALAPRANGANPPTGAARGWRTTMAVTTCVVLIYAAWRGWDTWPAVDRRADRRADGLIARVAQGIDDRSAILAAQMDWQSENALLYSARYERRDLPWTRLPDVMLHFPFLVRDNHAIGRDVVLTADAAAEISAAYGRAFEIVADPPFGATSLIDALERLPRGTPYIVALLTPPRDERFDPAVFDSALDALMDPVEPRTDAAYQIWAGSAREGLSFHYASQRPFRAALTLLGDPFTVRMDAWLPFDAFRRGGFGRVLRGREVVLIVERGASLVWFGPDGSPTAAYMGGVYAPEPRFRIPAGATLGLAALPN
jgi:hypothetical protein